MVFGLDDAFRSRNVDVCVLVFQTVILYAAVAIAIDANFVGIVAVGIGGGVVAVGVGGVVAVVFVAVATVVVDDVCFIVVVVIVVVIVVVVAAVVGGGDDFVATIAVCIHFSVIHFSAIIGITLDIVAKPLRLLYIVLTQ